MSKSPIQTPQATPPLRPPGRRPDESGSSGSVERNSRTFMIIASAALFIVLAILVYGVLIYLPQLEEQANAASNKYEERQIAGTVSSPPVKNGTTTAGGEARQDDRHETRTREILAKLLALHSQLVSDNIQVWGQDSYRMIVDLIGKGDEHLQNSEFINAEEKYMRAYEKLQQLAADKSGILVSAVQAGMAALEQGNSVGAKNHFSTALAIDTGNQKATDGLQRAQNLEAVLTFLAQGEEYEKQGKLKIALQEYRKGYNLDKKFPPVVKAYERLEERVKEQELKEHLSQFYSDLEGSNLQRAEASLKKALRLAPADPAAISAKQKLESAREEQAVLRMRQQAENQMSNEEWKKAFASYQQVLKIAPQAAFALQGVEVARRNSELVEQIDTLLNNKERFQDEKVLQNGLATLEYARQLEGLGPRTTARVNDLDEALIKASQPVSLILQSDNLTEVTMYHVGRLGRFYQRELILKPGKYTIVGERAGYRVKRAIIELTPERPEVEYTIKCEEAF